MLLRVRRALLSWVRGPVQPLIAELEVDILYIAVSDMRAVVTQNMN